MKKIFLAFLSVASLCTSCDFLDQPAYGVLGEDNTDAEKLCLAAYAGVGNDEINRPISFWGYGNVRADDAYKGGNDINDGITRMCSSYDETIRHGEYELKGHETYVRVKCTDKNGKTAWSNPIWL